MPTMHLPDYLPGSVLLIGAAAVLLLLVVLTHVIRSERRLARERREHAADARAGRPARMRTERRH